MKLDFLQWIIREFSHYQYIQHIKRVTDNIFKLTLDDDIYYIDLTKGASTIFKAPLSLGYKEYTAPFDISLSRYCHHALIRDIQGDGNNKILRFLLAKKQSYKNENYELQFEFTGRNTNAILLRNGIVLDALRHINKERSFRVVKIGEPLEALPQPKHIHIHSNIKDFKEFLETNHTTHLSKQLDCAKKTAIHQIEKKICRTSHYLMDIQDPQKMLQEAQNIKHNAQFIIHALYQLPATKINNSITINDSHNNAHTIELPQESRSYAEAAQILFKHAKKLEQKGKNTHIQQEILQQKIEFYNRQKELIMRTNNIQDIAIYSQKQPTKAQKHKKEYYESFFIEGIKISFGKNKQENIALLRDAKADDIWMHIYSIPSSHMILRSFNKTIPLPILQKAAEVLVSFTKGSGGNYEIHWTKRKFVKITEGSCVNYSKYKTITLKKEF